jgi:hypothetical protein
MLVEATAKGHRLARNANEILGSPPAALSELAPSDIDALNEILDRITMAP